MSGGLLALLDDIVALTKLTAASLDDAAAQAAKAASNAAGVVIDDTAVTPRYVVGLAAERELPIVGKIALGSLKNKLVFLLPAAILLSAFAPWALTPLLMTGGLYLCFEGYEKIHGWLAANDNYAGASAVASPGTTVSDVKQLEDVKVAGAIRTDFVLSAEIMAIALASITEPSLLTQALALTAVAVLVTAGVYGTVALIVKADDFGLHLAQKKGALLPALGRGLVYGMPPLLNTLALVGTFAMLWVGGGILLHGLAKLGIERPEHAIQSAADAVASVLPELGGFTHWFASAILSAIFGTIAGAITALVVQLVGRPMRLLLGREV